MDIAIVGCGIGGMAAATFLARDGHRVSLFERFENAGPVGSGLMIQPTGQAILSKLGLLEALQEKAQPVQYLKGVDHSGAQPLDLNYKDLDSGWSGYGVHRSVLFDMLFEAMNYEDVELSFGLVVKGRAPTPGNRSKLLFENASLDQEFDLIIDAAGVSSPLHETAPLLDRNFSYGAVWSTLRLEGVDTRCLTQRHRGAKQMLGALPLKTAPDSTYPGDPFAVFWSLKQTDMDTWPQRFDDWMVEEAEPLWPEIANAMRTQLTAGDFQAAKYRDLVLKTFIEPGMAHLGDSAHATSPQLGQGGNLALVDAYVLTQCLQAEATVEQALERYDSVRRPLVRLYQRFSRICTPMFQSDIALFGSLRNLGFPLAMQIAPIRKTMNRVMAGVQTGWLPWQHKPVNDIVSLNP